MRQYEVWVNKLEKKIAKHSNLTTKKVIRVGEKIIPHKELAKWQR